MSLPLFCKVTGGTKEFEYVLKDAPKKKEKNGGKKKDKKKKEKKPTDDESDDEEPVRYIGLEPGAAWYPVR